MHRIGVTCTATAVALVVAGTSTAATYRVRWGDTLTGIAAAHGTTVSALAAANGLKPSRILLEGTVLNVPGGGGGGGSYRVQPGDTLSGIAARYGTSAAALARANGLASPDFILAGWTLSISGGIAPGTASPSTAAAAWSAEASIDAWSAHYGVDARLARALAWMESGYQPGVVSHAGAVGVMQVTPPAWLYVENVLLGTSVPRTPDGNVRIGVALLLHLLHTFGGDERLALAAYYQGERSVRTRGVLPTSELYVDDILALKSRV